MRLAFLVSLLSFSILSCSSNDATSDPVLDQPAYQKITDSIRQFPNNAELHYHRGSLFYHNNQLLHAEQDLKKAWQLAPTEQHALSVVTVLKRKNTDSAIIFIREALKLLPESISLQIGLARGYQAKSNVTGALNVVNDILSKHPGQLDALMLKNELLQQQGKDEEALAALETAFNYAPDDKEVAYELAYEYAMQKKPQALELADALIRADASETAARAEYIKATYYKNIGRTDEAIKHYNASIRRNYNLLDAYLDKGILLYEQKQYDKAGSTFELGMRINPAAAEFYYWTAKVQQAIGKTNDAKLNYQRAYSLDNSMTEARDAAKSL